MRSKIGLVNWCSGLMLLCGLALPCAAEEEDKPILIIKSSEELARAKPPKLAVKPTLQRRLMVQQGRTGKLGAIDIRNAGGQTLRWKLGPLPGWLRADSTEGSLGYGERKSVSLTVDAKGAAPGPKRHDIVIDADGALGGPVSVRVEMEVRSPPSPPKPRPTPPKVAEPEIPPERDGDPLMKPPRERKSAFGVRTGVTLPGSGELADYDSNFVLGLYYRPRKLNGSKLVWEFAVGFGGSETSEEYDSRPITGDAQVLFPLGSADRKTRGYLLTGLGTMIELVQDTAGGTDYTNYVGVLDLGGGLAFGDGRYEARFTYGFYLGSDNLTGQALLALGYSF